MNTLNIDTTTSYAIEDYNLDSLKRSRASIVYRARQRKMSNNRWVKTKTGCTDYENYSSIITTILAKPAHRQIVNVIIVLRKMGSKYQTVVFGPQKGTSLRRTASFDIFCVKISVGVYLPYITGEYTWRQQAELTVNCYVGHRMLLSVVKSCASSTDAAVVADSHVIHRQVQWPAVAGHRIVGWFQAIQQPTVVC